MHIAIAGNIGSGKTTLATLLAQHYHGTLCHEPVIDNPYLADYYADLPRWAFNLEVFFLKERVKTLVHIAQQPMTTFIQDRTIYEGVYVFAANNYAQGNMSERDYTTYTDLVSCMLSLVTPPDILIYIRSSLATLLAQIHQRGRDYEQTITTTYLQGLNDLYEAWIASYPGRMVIIDGDTCKFGTDAIALHEVIARIDDTLANLP